MRDLGLDVTIDEIGNVIGTRAGLEAGAPVMTGSHIDTVRTGGRYDGNLGVLAGLEVIEVLEAAGVTTRRPLAVAFFTNEEGSRFQPDMMGSLTYVGGLALEEALDVVGIDGATVGDELMRSATRARSRARPRTRRVRRAAHRAGPGARGAGSDNRRRRRGAGNLLAGAHDPRSVQPRGTTPMAMRRDAGYAAAEIVGFLRRLANEIGGPQVATVGRLDLHPDLVNVVPGRR
jgi:N-carbamoyl-L-amino-acid hydrolase